MRTKRLLLIAGGGLAVVIALAVTLVLVLGGGKNLDDDPRGEEACKQLEQSIRYGGDTEVEMGSLLLAGKAAAKARTEEIRDTVEVVEGLEDFPIADRDELQAACEDYGYEFPDD